MVRRKRDKLNIFMLLKKDPDLVLIIYKYKLNQLDISGGQVYFDILFLAKLSYK
jgi:hypothetical protein